MRVALGEAGAGAGFFEPLGLFQHDDAEPVARQRQRRREPADAGAATMTVREEYGSARSDWSDRFASGAFRRPRCVRIERCDRSDRASNNTGR